MKAVTTAIFLFVEICRVVFTKKILSLPTQHYNREDGTGVPPGLQNQ